LWVGARVAAGCAPLIPWLAFGYAFGAAAHQNSIATLFGMARHRWYNYGLVIESLVMLGGWILFVPARPLSFAAAWWSISFVLNRGLRPTWSVARALGMSFADLLSGIYLRPLAAMALTACIALVLLLRARHSNWYLLAAMAAITGSFHLGCCFIFVLAPEHRRLLLSFRPQSSKSRTQTPSHAELIVPGREP
jgi:hypothetical protein